MALLNAWVRAITHLSGRRHGEGCLRNSELCTADLEAYDETTAPIDLTMGVRSERSQPARRRCSRLGRDMRSDRDQKCAPQTRPPQLPPKSPPIFLNTESTQQFCGADFGEDFGGLTFGFWGALSGCKFGPPKPLPKIPFAHRIQSFGATFGPASCEGPGAP